MSENTNTDPQGELRFDGRVMIVTGAGRGMGREHAKLLARRGAKVVVNDLGTARQDGGDPSPGPAYDVVREIEEEGGTAIPSADSVATPEGVDDLINTTIERWGRIDGILHNAGIANYKFLADTNFDEYRAIAAVHLDGAFLLTHAAWPHMARQGYGRLLYITSAGGLAGFAGQGSYATAKTGMIGLMNVARLEGEEVGIGVNMLGVAAYTRMSELMFAGNSDRRKRMSQWWQRYMRADIVAPVAAWLLHEDCPINGEIIETGGGHVARVFLAETSGYTNLDLTPEDVRDNFDQIRDESNYRVYRTSRDLPNKRFLEMIRLGADPIDGVAGQ